MATHRFSPTVYHNVIGSLPPALHIADGDTVVTETLDAAGYDKHDTHRISGPNPMNGPIFIEGAEPGDALKVEILAMRPTRDTGFTRSVVASNVVDPQDVRALPESKKAIWQIDREALTTRLAEPVADHRRTPVERGTEGGFGGVERLPHANMMRALAREEEHQPARGGGRMGRGFMRRSVAERLGQSLPR